MVIIMSDSSCFLTPTSISKSSPQADKSQMSSGADLDKKSDTSSPLLTTVKRIFGHENTETIWKYSLLLQESKLFFVDNSLILPLP